MIINNTPFMTDLETILSELQTQLRANSINYLKDIKDGPENVMLTCPYHKGGQERRPSMGVKKTDGTCHCFTCEILFGYNRSDTLTAEEVLKARSDNILFL